MNRRAAAVLALATALELGACATQPRTLYAWGSYEDIVYAATVNPGSVTPDAQIHQMELERETARNANGRLPPGWHAHLAFLYSQVGQTALAHDELVAEKAAFPEAAVFCDTLLANLESRAAASTEKRP